MVSSARDIDRAKVAVISIFADEKAGLITGREAERRAQQEISRQGIDVTAGSVLRLVFAQAREAAPGRTRSFGRVTFTGARSTPKGFVPQQRSVIPGTIGTRQPLVQTDGGVFITASSRKGQQILREREQKRVIEQSKKLDIRDKRNVNILTKKGKR